MAFNDWGKQQFPQGWLTKGSIRRDSPAPQNRFQAPNAGISPSLSGPGSPIVHTDGFSAILNHGAHMYTRAVRSQQRYADHEASLQAQADAHDKAQAQQATAQRQANRRSGIKYAKAKSRVNKRNNQAQAQAQAQTQAQQTAANQPSPLQQGYAQALGQLAQAQAQTQVQNNPLSQAWNTSPNNPANPWRTPTGRPSRNAPPIPFGQALPAPTGKPARNAPPAPGTPAFAPPTLAPPAPPTPQINWNAPGATPQHVYTPVPTAPAPGTKAWYKEQAAQTKQKQAAMPPAPPSASPWGAPTLITPPKAPAVAKPAATRSGKRTTKTTEPKTAPEIVGALTPVENLTQTPPQEASAPAAKQPRVRASKATPTPSLEPAEIPAAKPASKPATTRTNTRKTAPPPEPTVAPAAEAPSYQ
jgi:hypothetical protein